MGVFPFLITLMDFYVYYKYIYTDTFDSYVSISVLFLILFYGALLYFTEKKKKYYRRCINFIGFFWLINCANFPCNI